ncbi:MAG: dipeptidase [Myxococcota bacterium]|nr:dipeptidase [Myxococcota bacterium]
MPVSPSQAQVSDEARALHDDCLVMDLHCDSLLNESLLGYDPTRRHSNRLPGSPWLFHADIPRLKEGGVGAVALGIVVNPLRRKSALRATTMGLKQMAAWQDRAPQEVLLVSCAEDIRRAQQEDKIAVFAGLEGAHGLGTSLDELVTLRELGLRYVGLVHFTRNAAATPAFGWRANRTEGLSDFGRDLVDELNERRVLVDLAHINRPGFLEAAERSRVPVIVSHTGVQGAYETWRNIDDEQLRAVAETGGVICIIFAPIYLEGRVFGTTEGIVRHIRHVIDVVGEEHVGIGSDLDGFIFPPTDMPDVSCMPWLTQAMLDAGLSATQVRKCLGGNMLRVFEEVCG